MATNRNYTQGNKDRKLSQNRPHDAAKTRGLRIREVKRRSGIARSKTITEAAFRANRANDTSRLGQLVNSSSAISLISAR